MGKFRPAKPKRDELTAHPGELSEFTGFGFLRLSSEYNL